MPEEKVLLPEKHWPVLLTTNGVDWYVGFVLEVNHAGALKVRSHNGYDWEGVIHIDNPQATPRNMAATGAWKHHPLSLEVIALRREMESLKASLSPKKGT